MYCPNCKSDNMLYNEDFDEYYCLVCNQYFVVEIPSEQSEQPQDDTERKELETLII